MQAESTSQKPAFYQPAELPATTTFEADVAALQRLCALLNAKPRRRSLTKLALMLARHKIMRDPVSVARRYLRRFTTGAWCGGSQHVGRPRFGPAICFTLRQNKAYLDRCQ